MLLIPMPILTMLTILLQGPIFDRMIVCDAGSTGARTPVCVHDPCALCPAL